MHAGPWEIGMTTVASKVSLCVAALLVILPEQASSAQVGSAGTIAALAAQKGSLVEQVRYRSGFRARYYSYYAWPRYYPGIYDSYRYNMVGYPPPRGAGWRWNGTTGFYRGPRFYSGPYFYPGWQPW